MEDHNLKSIDLKLKVSPGLISDILNYKKGFCKDIIRRLATLFKLSQEAFTRHYKLAIPENSRLRNAKLMNTKKKLAA